ncbi:MAG: hypothetical protein E7529_05825 [Ruminococcaceae bacterium]|nr:hypothetical protein [Oscillospiraceae bacterium]
MKRFVSVLLTLVMCISLSVSLTTTASAGLFDGVETGQMQDTSFDGGGTIYWEFSYNTLKGTASLRLSGDGYMPNGTDQSWLMVQQQKQCYITELVIEEGVKSIMEGAFYGEEKLKYVTLPSTLEFIGDSAFADTAVEFVTLPKNLRDFNGTIFNTQSFTQYSVSPENPYYKAIDGVVYSKDLTRLVAYPIGRFSDGGANNFKIPETVTEISSYAFLNCQHSSFKIPGTVKDIQYQAFAGNTNLSSIDIENGVEKIYDNAFLACNNLSSIHLPTSVNYIGYCAIGFGYAFDFEGLSFMLDQKGIEHEKVTEENAVYYASLTGFSLDCFIICVVNENTKIYAPTNSAGHNYCKMFGVEYRSSQAITPKLISAKQAQTGVKIKWTYSSDADGYYIYRKNKSGDYEKIATISDKNKTDYTDQKAYPSYKNTYTVKAYNTNGVSRYFTKGVSAYYIPTPKLESAKNTVSGIKVSWKKVSTATNYNIYRKQEGETYWEHIGSTKKSRLYFVDKDVVNSEKYQYTVRAYDSNSVSEYNTDGVGAKRVDAPKISSFKNITGGVYLKWEKVSGASSYRVYRKTENGSWKLIKKLNNKTFKYTDSDVKSGVKYSYAVKAVSSGTLSGYYTKTIEYLKKPVISSAKSTKSGITINYSKTVGADGYRIYRRLRGEDEWTRIATVKGASNRSYKDTTAKKGKTYYYTVRAYSGSYKSAYDSKLGYKIKDKY